MIRNVVRILIRDVTGTPSEAPCYQKAFSGVPPSVWTIFHAPAGIMGAVAHVPGGRQMWLIEVRQPVEREGELTEATIQKLVQHFGEKPNGLKRGLEELRQKQSQNPEVLDAARDSVLPGSCTTLSELPSRSSLQSPID